jgi:hypothetical protein
VPSTWFILPVTGAGMGRDVSERLSDLETRGDLARGPEGRETPLPPVAAALPIRLGDVERDAGDGATQLIREIAIARCDRGDERDAVAAELNRDLVDVEHGSFSFAPDLLGHSPSTPRAQVQSTLGTTRSGAPTRAEPRAGEAEHHVLGVLGSLRSPCARSPRDGARARRRRGVDGTKPAATMRKARAERIGCWSTRARICASFRFAEVWLRRARFSIQRACLRARLIAP